MLTTAKCFGSTAAIVALGYAADMGNVLYENAREQLTTCEKYKKIQLDQLAESAKELYGTGHIGTAGNILQIDDIDTLARFTNLIFAKYDIERSCRSFEQELNTFTAQYIAPYLQLISDASLPAAALPFAAKLTLIAYRAICPNNKVN